jgi:hypothetical protein
LKLFSCIHINDNPILIHHFIKYYRKCGIDDFRIILHANEEYNKELSPHLEAFENFLASMGLSVGKYWLEEKFTDEKKQDKLNDYKREVCGPEQGEGDLNQWTIQADVDEFIDEEIFTDEALNSEGNFIMGKLSDRVSASGDFLPITEDSNLFELFPTQTMITKYVNNGDDNKVPLSRASVMLGPGHHWPLPTHQQPYREKIIETLTYKPRVRIHHFKYMAGTLENIKEKIINNVNISEVGWKGEMMKFILFLLLECKGPKLDLDKLVMYTDED